MSFSTKILVVDDDKFSRTITARRMTGLGAFAVEAEDGEAALRLLRNEEFALIVLDLDMPKLDGFGLLGCIRGHPKWQHLPVLVLTGHDDRDSVEKALSAGATSFLCKPLNWTAFSAHIEHLVNLATAPQAAQSQGHTSDVEPTSDSGAHAGIAANG